jgi:hypothetical protein
MENLVVVIRLEKEIFLIIILVGVVGFLIAFLYMSNVNFSFKNRKVAATAFFQSDVFHRIKKQIFFSAADRII